MKKRTLTEGCFLLAGFILYTLLVKFVDVQPIGPDGSLVGFASVNEWVQRQIGVHLWWYELTDWLGFLSVAVGAVFAAVGACQLIRRKGIGKVDPEILWLGVFYLAIIGCYMLFNAVVINDRPVLLAGEREASYPSTHTMAMICVMSTAHLPLKRVWPEKPRRLKWIRGICLAVMVVTIVGRILAGVHWVTDILGGVILAVALVRLYQGVITE